MANCSKIYSKLLVIIPLLFISGFTRAQNWSWAAKGGGIYNDKATDLDIDSAGNLYVSGYYNVGQPANTSAFFGNITAPAGNWGKEGFLAKISANGNWQWVKAAIGGWDERVLGIHVDRYNHYVYATGTSWYLNPFTFGNCPTPNVISGADEIFVSKFDFNGNCIWQIGAGSDGDDHGYDLATDKAGNIYLTGFLSDHYGWFGNPGYFGSITVPMNSDSIAYVAKLSSNGVFQWVNTFDALEGERDNRIAVDSVGNVYITGGYKGIKQFGSTTLTSAGGYDILVLKYDANGNLLYAKSAGSTLDDRGNSITVDHYGDIYVTGEFRDRAVFDNDTINNNGSPNGRDIFVAKMKPGGNWVWAKKAGSNSGSERGDRIISDKKGNLFVTGQFKDTASFGSSVTIIVPPNDSNQVFVAAIDTSGKWKWALAGGGPVEDRGTGLACDDSCNVYNCGYYEANGIFGSNTLTGWGKKEVYVAKIDGACLNVLTVNTTNVVCNGQCNGSATANFTGTGPFTYTWSTSPTQNTQTATSLCAGVYTVYVGDGLGGVFTSTINITEPAALSANLNSSANASCNSLCNGQAQVSVSGGTAGYTYSWNTIPTQSTATAINLCAGNYTCTVTDSYNCVATQTVSIIEPSAITALVSTTSVVCNNSCSGTAALTASGGVSGYSYSWNTFPVQTTAGINNLCLGNYICTVTDANNCVETFTAGVIGPPPITATDSITPISCSGASNGVALLNVSGGVGPYNYYWNANPPQSGNPATNLSPGTHTVAVEDMNGCIEEFEVVIADLPPTDSLVITSELCYNDPTQVLMAPAGSYIGGPYQWYINIAPITGATGNAYTTPVNGTGVYSVTWYHKGCKYVSSTLLQTVYPDINSLPITNIFTPNDDKLNDTFFPLSLGAQNSTVTLLQLEQAIKEYELYLYDRWGKLLFSTNQVSDTWNGKDKNGNTTPEGTYYWIARYKAICSSIKDEQVLKGFVQLIR